MGIACDIIGMEGHGTAGDVEVAESHLLHSARAENMPEVLHGIDREAVADGEDLDALFPVVAPCLWRNSNLGLSLCDKPKFK